MDLFNVTLGIPYTSGEKPRDATREERDAYLRWLAQSRGVAIPSDAEWSDAGIFSNPRTAGGRRAIVAMPGYGAQPIPTVDILDDAGNVVRTMPLPVRQSGKGAGSIPADAKQVLGWTGLVVARKRRAAAKPVEARQPAAAPIQPEALESRPAAPVAETAAHSAPVIDPALSARVGALETMLGRRGFPVRVTLDGAANDNGTKPERTAAERRAIVRAWRMRCEARAVRADLRMAETCRDMLVIRSDDMRDARDAATARAADMERIALANEERAAEMERRADDEAARAVAAERKLWSAEERTSASERRAGRMVRVAADYRKASRRAAEDVRGARAESRVLARRLEDAQRAAASRNSRPADAPPTDSTMARAFAAAR